MIPRQWKVVQARLWRLPPAVSPPALREKFSCRDCEAITQPPAPFHVVPRGWAGPSFLAMMLFEKYGQHQPLNRQADRFEREGAPLSLSTLADQVGAATAALHAALPADRSPRPTILMNWTSSRSRSPSAASLPGCRRNFRFGINRLNGDHQFSDRL